MNLQKGDALILVDVQRDFLPEGSLAVADGDAIVVPLNGYLQHFSAAGLPIYATRDWHPSDHCSFAAQGGPWPQHCVAGSDGAAFADALRLPEATQVVSKATSPSVDAYSGFDDTGLAQSLREAGARRLFIGGLATDYCVLATVRDAVRENFDVVLLLDAVRAVNVEQGDGDRALQAMRDLGVTTITLAALEPDE